MDLYSAMTQNPFFGGFPAEDLGVIGKIARLRSVSAGTPIFVAKMQGESGFLLADGHVDLLLPRGSQQYFLARLDAPDHFGTRRLISPGPRRVSAHAVTDSVLIEIGYGDLLQMRDYAPYVYGRVIERSQWWHAKHTESFAERFNMPSAASG
jgi:CRP-like cAMP-binding protein